ncbi:MAG: putative toxin-antitoxin system toxin component, PIN family [Deltaproteobacteria bacterium]|nr:putative toxin-antitoxin system toxin component, PIN family [Deltaproteobacteria bacterium]MCB9488772.1 putative toxin-antitoxin system toxin component, PIN family [Deltaproteobacteria bacterium]
MIKVVLDTNVLISALLTPGGNAARIVQLIDNVGLVAVTSDELLAEFRRVRNYQKVVRLFERAGIEPEAVEEFVTRIASESIVIVHPAIADGVHADPTDNKFLACAVAAEASFIISGDRHLLELDAYEGIPIVTPTEFLEEYQRQGFGGG